MYHRLFSEGQQIVPNLSEVYELALAFYESQLLTNEELLKRSAYFAKIDDAVTNHFMICTGDPVRLPKSSSSRLKSFFQKNQFRTGYATHGLFPYRGKFHPQMVKGIINVMGLKPGETVLDPMMGSGTVLIEASVMGIKSIGLDASPFCRFMTKTKLDALLMPLEPLQNALENYQILFEYFSGAVGLAKPGSKQRSRLSTKPANTLHETDAAYEICDDAYLTAVGSNHSFVRNFLLLAYLDSAGYSERSQRKSPLEQFRDILERYKFVVEKIQKVIQNIGMEIVPAAPIEGDARTLPIADRSIHGILFSPPYSFAIDYVKNDAFHLNCMGIDIPPLKNRMVGLRGKTLREKYNHYVEDMDKVLAECARVLRQGRFCTLIIGTNDNQLSKALGQPKESVKGLDQVMITLASGHGFTLFRTLSRQISGIANTMRHEHIVILQRD